MDLHHDLLQRLRTTTGSENEEPPPGFFRGLIFISFIAILSVWANYEASKGFEVSIINQVPDTPLGRRFSLFFLSNDEATRIVLQTSDFAQKILYDPRKKVDRITVKLVGRNLTHPEVHKVVGKDEYVVHVGASVMRENNVGETMAGAVQRGMARVWLWDGKGSAPESLLEGMVELVGILAGFGEFSGRLPESDSICWRDKDWMAVAEFLNYCEEVKNGFVGRLNQKMSEGWDDEMVDDALGVSAQQLCGSYRAWRIQELGHGDDGIVIM